MSRNPRFPGIDWKCDHCGAFLNTQKNFDDHKYIWKCTECGYKNSISWDNITYEDSAATKFLLHVLGFLSYVGLWTAVMLAISISIFNADSEKYHLPFLYSLGLYLFATIIAIIAEFALRHRKLSLKNCLSVAFRNLKEDLISPLMAAKEVLAFLISLLSRKPKNIGIFLAATIYLLIFIFEIVALSNIIGFDFSDWINLFKGN